MMARQRVFVFVSLFFLSFNFYKVRQEICEFNPKITIIQPLRLIIVYAKPKIHTSRRGYLSPGNSIVLEIEAALLFISVKHAFLLILGSFVEILARFLKIDLFISLTVNC